MKQTDETLSSEISIERKAREAIGKTLTDQKSRLESLAEKVANLFTITEKISNNDDFAEQVEKIHALATFANTSAMASISGQQSHFIKIRNFLCFSEILDWIFGSLN